MGQFRRERAAPSDPMSLDLLSHRGQCRLYDGELLESTGGYPPAGPRRLLHDKSPPTASREVGARRASRRWLCDAMVHRPAARPSC